MPVRLWIRIPSIVVAVSPLAEYVKSRQPAQRALLAAGLFPVVTVPWVVSHAVRRGRAHSISSAVARLLAIRSLFDQGAFPFDLGDCDSVPVAMCDCPHDGERDHGDADCPFAQVGDEIELLGQ